MQFAEPDVRNGVDPFFGLQLFLAIPVRSHLLWVANLNHLEFLYDYIGANLRKRSLHPHNMTMMARLPHWMKRSQSRAAITASLDQLRAAAIDEGIA